MFDEIHPVCLIKKDTLENVNIVGDKYSYYERKFKLT